MKKLFEKSVLFTVVLTGSGAVLAHPGAHGAEGFLAGVGHLLGEHGYLAVILPGVLGAVLLRRSRRS